MKNRIIISMVLIVMLFATQSCTKEDVEMKSDNMFKEFLSIGSDTTEATITLFLEQLENPSSGPSMCVDEVIWNIEAALNYKYGDIERVDYSNSIIGSFNLQYSVNDNGLLKFDQIKDLFDDFKQELSTVNDAISSDDKWLVLVDIDFDDDSNLKMSYCFGVDETVLTTVFDFGSTDYWHYGSGLGKCSSYAGQGGSSDAANQIDLMIRAYRQWNASAPPGTASAPSNISYPGPIIAGYNVGGINPINPNDVTAQDNQYDYLLAHGVNAWPNYHICLDPTEMNFYYLGAWSLIYQQNAVFPNKQLIYTNIDDGYSGTYNNPTVFFHGLTTQYANIYYTINRVVSPL